MSDVVEYRDGAGALVCRSIERAPTPVETNTLTVRDRVRKLLGEAKAYLALTNPTAAQTTAQVRRNTRATLLLSRLMLAELDDISDTDGV